MPAPLRDRYGVEVEAPDEAAVAVFDEAVHSLVGLEGDPLAAANAAAADPSLPLARCLAAYLHCYSASQSGYARARAVVGAARPAGMRERAHFAAASAWADGDLEAAVRHLERALLRDPRDLLALKVTQDFYFSLGDRVNLRDVVARVLPAWAAGTPGAGFVRGMYAFGLEECGDYRAAERYGRAAIDANARDAWAAHAVIHVFEMEGRQADGLAFVAATPPDWGPSFFAVHNWWHSALYHLELGQLDAALAVYDDRVAAEGLATPLGQLDAASLLWRLWLHGVEPGDRASELADAVTAWVHDSTHVFNDWHATMALTLAGRIADAEALAAEMPARARGKNRFMVERAGLDVIRGVIAVGRGELKRAVDLLSRARPHAHVFGGSHAQRDAIDLTLLAAAAAAAADPVSGDATDDALVRALVAERAARKQTAERAARLVIDASLARARRRGRARDSAPRTPQRIGVTMTADRYESLDGFDLLKEDAAEFGLSWDGPPTVTRLSAAAGGGAVSVRRWGTEVPDLVLLHGAALNAHTWDTFALAAKRPLLALDLPGHGESAWRDDAQYGPETLVPAVAEVIREHAKAPVTVVGQSLGGLTAIALAAAHPALVGRLVLVDVTPGISNATQVRSFLAGPTVFASRAEIVERARAFGSGRTTSRWPGASGTTPGCARTVRSSGSTTSATLAALGAVAPQKPVPEKPVPEKPVPEKPVPEKPVAVHLM